MASRSAQPARRTLVDPVDSRAYAFVYRAWRFS
jgi:hypothetical protein